MIDFLLDHWIASLGILTLVVVLFVACGGCGHENYQPATILAATYAPSSVSYVAGKNGGAVFTREKYVLVVRFSDGAVDSIEISSASWAEYHEGDLALADRRWWGLAAIRHVRWNDVKTPEPGK